MPCGGRPAVPGAARRSAGRGDARPRHLGRAVEVVDVVAEQVHPALGQRAGQRRAGDGDDAQLRQVVAASASPPAARGSAASSPAPRSAPSHSCWAVSDSVASGSNLRLSTSVEDRLMPSVKCTKPHEWNIGAAIIVFSRAFSGIMASSAAAGSSDLGCEREAPLGVPGGARGEDDRLAALARRARPAAMSPLAARSSSSGSLRLAVVGVVPGDEALAPPRGVVDQLLELVVVDQRLRLLALGDVGELRAREGRVEEQHVGAELRARHHRLDEAAVVAAHQAHVVALADPVGGEPVRERVGALVDLAEGQRAELVDQRDLVAVALGGGGVAAGRASARSAPARVRRRPRGPAARGAGSRPRPACGP